MQRSNERFVERLPLVLSRPAYGYALTTLLCLTGLLLRILVQPVVPIGYPALSFFPAVMLACFLFGLGPGVYAAVLCGFLSWYVFLPPAGSWLIDPGVVLALCFYALVVTIALTVIWLLQRANFHLAVERERSAALARNRELLFHELQHRVSNNLQVVAAMLALQRRHVDDEMARRALDDASNRMALVGKISRALYDPSGAGQALRPFLTMLARDIMAASGRDDIAITVGVPDAFRLDPNVAVPLALIFAEAVSNAVEHGFAGRGGAIAVRMDRRDDRLSLHVLDDGGGLAPGFRIGEGGSLGLKMATALATQIGGRFTLEPGPGGGAEARLDFPAQRP